MLRFGSCRTSCLSSTDCAPKTHGDYESVIAPRLAVDMRVVYLASTPVVYRGLVLSTLSFVGPAPLLERPVG
jgi:hypothetical protein